MSQSWRLFALEVGIISCKKEAFQALCVAKNMAWNPLTLMNSTSPLTAEATLL